MSEIDRADAEAAARPLSLYLPGSCAQFIDELGAAFARIVPAAKVEATRVSMTGIIAAEVLAGALADVFLSANESYIDQLRDAGLVPTPFRFARNRLAIFVRPGAEDRVTSLEDLTRDDVRVLVFPADDDPGGAYTVELFARAGYTETMAKKRESGTLTILSLTGRSMNDMLANAEIDAFVAYRTLSVRMPGLRLVDLGIPKDLRDRIVFTVGSVVRDGVRHPDADALVNLLLGPEGQAILARHGFLPVD
jgi:molybdate transport system substrate-binding protein